MNNNQNSTMSNRIDELVNTGIKWWPQQLVEEVAQSSPALILKSTQDEFFKCLANLDPQPTALRKSIESVPLAFNLFLKHLLVLADFGGEKVKRIHLDRMNFFNLPEGGHGLQARFNDQFYDYQLKTFVSSKSISNSRLGVDGKSLVAQKPPNELAIDLVLIILLGYFSINSEAAENLSGCDLIRFLGKPDDLQTFAIERYIEVSRINQGATANSLGQALQGAVKVRLESLLGPEFSISTNDLQVIGERRLTSDLMVSSNGKKVAIEIAFQQTTNSVIERKATDAPQRKHDLNSKKIASCFVLDGIGNFERRSALEKIVEDSDLVVNFSESHLGRLATFIKTWCK